MRNRSRLVWLAGGALLGAVFVWWLNGQPRPVRAATLDRHEDFIMCTGPVSLYPGVPLEGVWLLDYKAGKLLGTVIDRVHAKVISWAEVDLVSEYGIAPKQNVHFMMTTGNISPGQAALYLAEVTTGKMAVYSMSPRPDGRYGVAIRRHDMVLFRQPPP